jgi:prepilin peptidase CpaA
MSATAFVSSSAIAIGILASVVDVRTRRIPNVLTFGAALAGIAAHAALQGFGGALAAVSGWVVGTLLFLPFFLLRGMGGGDVKLLAALGAWIGPQEAVFLALYSLIAGGVLGLAVALARGYLSIALRNIGMMIMHWRIAGIGPVPEMTLETSGSPRLAFAVPILAGTVMTLWL